jgi:hypothetical protein
MNKTDDHCYEPPEIPHLGMANPPRRSKFQAFGHATMPKPSCRSHTHENQQKELASHKGMIIESRPWWLKGLKFCGWKIPTKKGGVFTKNIELRG